MGNDDPGAGNDSDGGDDDLKNKIVRKLLTNEVDESDPEQLEDVLDWFVDEERGVVRDCLRECDEDPEVPVSVDDDRTHNDYVYIDDLENAFDYQDNRFFGDDVM